MKKLFVLPLLAFMMLGAGCATRRSSGSSGSGSSSDTSTGLPEGGDGSSVDKALSIDGMLALMSSYSDNQVSSQEYYVKGVLGDSRYNSSHTSYNCYFQGHLKADSVPVYLYSGVMDSSITDDYTAQDSLAGKTVVVKGYLEKYVKDSAVTYEIPYLSSTLSPTGAAYSPTILSVE